MKKNLSFAGKLIVLIVPFLLPVSVWADPQTQGPGPASQPIGVGAGVPPGVGINTVQGVLNTVCLAFDYMFWFLVALAVIFGIVAAFRYLTASGEAEKVKKANNTLLYAAIAVAVALLAAAIPSIVASFFVAGGALPSC